MLSNIYNINKNIFNNLLINVFHHTCTLLFQKLLSRHTTPEPESTPMLIQIPTNADPTN